MHPGRQSMAVGFAVSEYQYIEVRARCRALDREQMKIGVDIHDHAFGAVRAKR